MAYPKNKVTGFVDLSEDDCRQVNLHKGRIYNYWFVYPAERPVKIRKHQVPDLLKGTDLKILGSF